VSEHRDWLAGRCGRQIGKGSRATWAMTWRFIEGFDNRVHPFLALVAADDRFADSDGVGRVHPA